MTDLYLTEPRLSAAGPTPADVARFVPYACNQLQAPFMVKVVMRTQDEYVSKTEERYKRSNKVKSAIHQNISNVSESKVSTVSVDPQTDRDMIVIVAVTDVVGNLVELIFYRCPDIPRLLIKIIGLCIPYHPYFKKLTLRWGPLDGPTLYEVAKLLSFSHITELNLDDSPVAAANYYMLLEEQTQLRCLSLARCNIDDNDCTIIASKLIHPLPAARTLVMLSLASNFICDVGACALGEALRSNRSLQYLNLSGNQIGDVGAASIFGSLMEFPLSCDEVVKKRQRQLKYLKTKEEVYTKYYNELTTALLEHSHDENSRTGKRKATGTRSRKSSITSTLTATATSVLDTVSLKAELMATELLGAYSDPFSIEETMLHDNYVYSMGNMTLCYLNLAYNSLSYLSTVKLLEVVTYQSEVAHKVASGLLRVHLVGNQLPVASRELDVALQLLDKAMICRANKQQKRPERSARSVKSK
ncbi:uncharacterized protein LOC113512482 [Galleria mellonella]|uniref:Uncharacterized protein LOC113512482 n=1 Tax=Galleria mellonella TaxID=7137 RepID=A0A6J1WFF8_GALME|nr:uncharacterized protein LOC113512482 [Galleria mellonella]